MSTGPDNSNERHSRPGSDNRWRLWSWVAVVAALLFGAGLGIIVIPLVQGGAGGVDAFTAICRAIGVLPGSPARPTPSTQATQCR